MPATGARFTIRSLMIVVAIAAVLMAFRAYWAVLAFAVVFGSPGFAWAVLIVRQGNRRAAAIGFWGPAIGVNLLYAAACTAPGGLLGTFLLIVWLSVFGPTIACIGVAWARLATRKTAVPRRSRAAAWSAVVGLLLMPCMTVSTLWPLRLAFLRARPVLDRLADQAAAGQSVGWPQWAGPYRLVRADVDPVPGHVALVIDPDPGGPSGFVRELPGARPRQGKLILGTDLEVDLGGGWSYRVED